MNKLEPTKAKKTHVQVFHWLDKDIESIQKSTDGSIKELSKSSRVWKSIEFLEKVRIEFL